MTQRIPYRTPRSQLVEENYHIRCPELSSIIILSFTEDGVGYLLQFTEDGVAYLAQAQGL